MEKHKWMVSFDDEQINWVKETATSTELSGSDIIRELVNKEMRDKNSRFRHELSQAKYRMQLRKIDDEQMKLEARRAEVTKQMKGERIAIPA